MGNGSQVVNQLIAIGITVGLSVASNVRSSLKLLTWWLAFESVGKMRLRGLDLSQHSEEAYNTGYRVTSFGSTAHEASHLATVPVATLAI